MAVLMAAAAKEVTGKIFAMFFPIMAFVVSGYEHCVANMYYIPAGLIAKQNEAYTAKAMEAYNLTQAQIDSLNIKTFFVNNLLFVTIGNIIGGMVFVGLIYYIVSREKNTAK